ncbi:hypothetical protein [Streptomyces sp. NBC_00470]
MSIAHYYPAWQLSEIRQLTYNERQFYREFGKWLKEKREVQDGRD